MNSSHPSSPSIPGSLGHRNAIREEHIAVVRPNSGPLFPEVGILAMVPYRWSHVWQPCNHILTRLARYFHVVWVNPPQNWSDVFFQRDSLHVPPHDYGPGFRVYQSPAWLPNLYRPRRLANLVFSQRMAHVQQRLIRSGCKRIVLYLWRPEFARALQSVSFDLSCYHIDDEYSFSPIDLPIPPVEARLIQDVDHVFIHSPALLEKKGKINPHTTFTPNGVDFNSYAQVVPEPADIAGIPHPRIGYSGHIKKQLDWPLLMHLAARHPEWSFVFVGDANRHPEIVGYLDQLSRLANVHFLGGKSVQELASYPQHFDVCLMPYSRDDYTRYIYPLKLHEYLASGRPVVGTPIASLEPFRHIVHLPETPDEWSAAIAHSLDLDANSDEQRAVRQSVAMKHDWDILVRNIAEAMALRLGPEFYSRMAQESSFEVKPSLGVCKT